MTKNRRRNGMSESMYNHIKKNSNKLSIIEDEGKIITTRGTNGYLNINGYLYVGLNKKTIKVHQILAVHYFGERCIGLSVNHIDGNKKNNKRENLELVTHKENMEHAIKTGLLKGVIAIEVKVDKLDLKGNFIKRYSSIKKASIENKCFGTDISAVCRGKRLTTGGYKWRYSS